MLDFGTQTDARCHGAMQLRVNNGTRREDVTDSAFMREGVSQQIPTGVLTSQPWLVLCAYGMRI
jgi:hypothetical protein